MELIEGVNAKVCTECKDLKIYDEFYKKSRSKDGYKGKCKKCIKGSFKEQNVDENIKKICNSCKRELPATKTYFHKDGKGKYGCRSNCKECHGGKFGYLIPMTEEERKEKRKVKARQYYEKNKDKFSLYIKENKDRYNKNAKKYYEKNKNKVLERERERYKKNGDILKQRVNDYSKTERGKITRRNAKHRRRERKKNGVGITLEQWNFCLNFFDNRCAYSGELATDYHMEHIVPLSKGGEHSVYNIIPCVGRYNIQKGTSDMEEWYRKQPYFSEERLHKIYEYTNMMKEIYLNNKAS